MSFDYYYLLGQNFCRACGSIVDSGEEYCPEHSTDYARTVRRREDEQQENSDDTPGFIRNKRRLSDDMNAFFGFPV